MGDRTVTSEVLLQPIEVGAIAVVDADPAGDSLRQGAMNRRAGRRRQLPPGLVRAVSPLTAGKAALRPTWCWTFCSRSAPRDGLRAWLAWSSFPGRSVPRPAIVLQVATQGLRSAPRRRMSTCESSSRSSVGQGTSNPWFRSPGPRRAAATPWQSPALRRWSLWLSLRDSPPSASAPQGVLPAPNAYHSRKWTSPARSRTCGSASRVGPLGSGPRAFRCLPPTGALT